MAAHRRLAADAGRDCLCTRRFLHSHHRRGRALAGRRQPPRPLPWRGLSIAFAFLLLVLAMRVYLGRFELLFDDHTIFGGVTYTDAHVTLTGMLVVCAALFWARRSQSSTRCGARGRWLVAAILPAAVCYVGVQVVGWYVSSFIVKPNELVREQPYIAHNIELTRQAYGLDQFAQREFPAETTVAAADPANNQATLQNIRLWDWHALQDTLRQIQEIRTYYDFPDIDIDRYQIDGTTARGDAGRARAECRQAAGEQPQLDQREADLHPWLRHHDESRSMALRRKACPL